MMKRLPIELFWYYHENNESLDDYSLAKEYQYFLGGFCSDLSDEFYKRFAPTGTTSVFDALLSILGIKAESGVVNSDYYLLDDNSNGASGFAFDLYEHLTSKLPTRWLLMNYAGIYESSPATFFERISTQIYNRFYHKWLKLAEALTADYAPLENYHMLEETTHGETITETPRVTRSHKISQNIKTDSKVTGNQERMVSAMDSSSYVPESKSINNDLNTNVSGLEADNYQNYTENEPTGIDTTAHSGTDKLERSGNIGVTTSQQMLESEVILRARHRFWEIVQEDIASMLVLAVY